MRNDSVSLDNRFGDDDAGEYEYRCGEQLDDRIVGGELCEIDKYFHLFKQGLAILFLNIF